MCVLTMESLIVSNYVLDDVSFSNEYQIGMFSSINLEGNTNGAFRIYGVSAIDDQERTYLSKEGKSEFRLLKTIRSILNEMNLIAIEVHLDSWSVDKATHMNFNHKKSSKAV